MLHLAGKCLFKTMGFDCKSKFVLKHILKFELGKSK